MARSLSATRMNDFLGCSHQAALWLAGVKADERVDPMVALVREKGFEHERRVLARLEAEHGSVVRIEDGEPLEAKVAATVAAIGRGAPLIYQGALVDGAWLGYPDFLIRRIRTDGAISYEPADAKLARKAKVEYVLQLGIYAGLLERRLGVAVGYGTIYGSTGIPEAFDLRETRHILGRLMRKFEAFVADEKRSTRPVPCTACAQCDYKMRCEAQWRADDSPYFVAGLSGAQVVKLEEGGVHTLTQLAKLDEGAEVAGIGTATLGKLAAQARLQVQARDTGRHEVEVLPPEHGRGFHLLPAQDGGDLFLDLEGDPLHDEGLEYLFGLWGRIAEDGVNASHSIWAHSSVEEKAAFETLIRLLIAHFERHPGAHLYHYAQYEPNALKRLAMRHATMEAELDQMLRDRRFVDLYRVTRQAIRASTEGYSLKDLERIYWKDRAGEVTTAGESVAEYERWCTTRDDAILDAIERYNQDDCISLAQLRSWLESKRPGGLLYQVTDDAPAEKAERTVEREEREARRQELASRVRACSSGDSRIRDLIAELLWFHQRAQKPGWWALFERQSWSEEELVDDPESLGGLIQGPDLLTSARQAIDPNDLPLPAAGYEAEGSRHPADRRDARKCRQHRRTRSGGRAGGATPRREGGTDAGTPQPPRGTDQSARIARCGRRLRGALCCCRINIRLGADGFPGAKAAAAQGPRLRHAGAERRSRACSGHRSCCHGPRRKLPVHPRAARNRENVHHVGNNPCTAEGRASCRRLLQFAQGDP